MSITTEKISAFISAGVHSMTEELYEEYLDSANSGTEAEQNLHEISATLDCKVSTHSIESMDLCEYEEAARRAGFYAGYAAAVEAFKGFLQKAA